MNYEFLYKGEIKNVELKDNRLALTGENKHPVELEHTPDGRLFLQTDGQRLEIFAAVDRDKTYVDIEGVLYEFGIPADEANGIEGAGGGDADPSKVFAPMPGKVVKLMVAEGDSVTEKQQLVIVEAMKMENVIIARGAGKVKAVNFAVGDKVDTDSPIIELEIEE